MQELALVQALALVPVQVLTLMLEMTPPLMLSPALALALPPPLKLVPAPAVPPPPPPLPLPPLLFHCGWRWDRLASCCLQALRAPRAIAPSCSSCLGRTLPDVRNQRSGTAASWSCNRAAAVGVGLLESLSH